MADREKVIYVYRALTWEALLPPIFALAMIGVISIRYSTCCSAGFLFFAVAFFLFSLLPAFCWKIVVTETYISGPGFGFRNHFTRVNFPLDRLDRKNSLKWRPRTPLYGLNGKRVCEIISSEGERIFVPPFSRKRFDELCRVLRG